MFYILKLIAKTISTFSKTFNIGSGYTWPGHIILKLYPNILKDKKIIFKKGIILISGTNGKTTTSKLLAHILRNQGYSVLHNQTGANLLNGIVACITLDGKFPIDYGVFECDEFALPQIIKELSPTCLVLLNLSRDQLDRYGEVDIIFERWQTAFKDLSSGTTIIADREQDKFSNLGEIFSGRVLYFDANEQFLAKSNLKGSFNAKNINASLMVNTFFNLDHEQAVLSLASFGAAYGRGEVITYKNVNFKIYLAKNPASFNRNLALTFDEEHDAILCILNDKIPDGRDVSWIYDIDPIKLYDFCNEYDLYVSGSRCLDMAIRLNYSQVKINKDNVVSSLYEATQKIIKNGKRNVIVFPNYSAMLEFRKVLIGRKIL